MVADSGIKTRIAVIGGGAAGFMAAIEACASHTRVQLFEKSNKLLSKVRISGGGRCNVLHDCPYTSELIKAYPRGGKSLKKAFSQFAYPQARAWFEERGLELKVESDGRVFPTSDNSASVIQVLEREAHHKRLAIELRADLEELEVLDQGYRLHFRGQDSVDFDKVILAFGGQPKLTGYKSIAKLNLEIVEPVPSLFTFNIKDADLHQLKGLSVPNAEVRIPGSKARQSGPLLITHWGLSGPAVLKLSAWEARSFNEQNYQFPILVNWTGLSESALRDSLQELQSNHPRKEISNAKFQDLPQRLWTYLVQRAGIHSDKKCGELAKKEANRLIEQLFASPFPVNGKSTFKEEFVTAGGIRLNELYLDRYELKSYPGIYAVGEMIDVDAITGGYNFQHAWTSGYLAGRHARSN